MMINFKNAFSQLYYYLNPQEVPQQVPEEPQLTVSERVNLLVDKGYKVYIKHCRRYQNEITEMTRYEYEKVNVDTNAYKKNILNNGGTTYVEIITPDGKFYQSSARCSLKDQFSRKEGRERALERCLNQM